MGEVRGGGEDGGGGWGVYHTQAADSGAFGMFKLCIKGKVIKRFLPPILVFYRNNPSGPTIVTLKYFRISLRNRNSTRKYFRL